MSFSFQCSYVKLVLGLGLFFDFSSQIGLNQMMRRFHVIRFIFQSGQLSWYHIRLVLGRSGVLILPSPIEFSMVETLQEKFYAVRHKIQLCRIEIEIMIWYIQSIHCQLDIAQKCMLCIVKLHVTKLVP